jgi:hypothetical protein
VAVSTGFEIRRVYQNCEQPPTHTVTVRTAFDKPDSRPWVVIHVCRRHYEEHADPANRMVGRCRCCGGTLVRGPNVTDVLVTDLCSDCLTCDDGRCDYAASERDA